jgi:hypothetical protein
VLALPQTSGSMPCAHEPLRRRLGQVDAWWSHGIDDGEPIAGPRNLLAVFIGVRVIIGEHIADGPACLLCSVANRFGALFNHVFGIFSSLSNRLSGLFDAVLHISFDVTTDVLMASARGRRLYAQVVYDTVDATRVTRELNGPLLRDETLDVAAQRDNLIVSRHIDVVRLDEIILRKLGLDTRRHVRICSITGDNGQSDRYRANGPDQYLHHAPPLS